MSAAEIAILKKIVHETGTKKYQTITNTTISFRSLPPQQLHLEYKGTT